MITLVQAFRLCDIRKDEIVSLRVYQAGLSGRSVPVMPEKVRRTLDMKQIKVHKIDTRFGYDGDFLGFEFLVTGITEDALRKKLEWS